VEWKNDDIVPHEVAGDGFDSGVIEPVASWRHVFQTKGQLPYKCTLHPTMKATLEIK
jgi:plastocyanin